MGFYLTPNKSESLISLRHLDAKTDLWVADIKM